MEITVKESPVSTIENGLQYRFLELADSTFILSNDILVESDNANGLCVLFWLGGAVTRIVLTTNVVR